MSSHPHPASKWEASPGREVIWGAVGTWNQCLSEKCSNRRRKTMGSGQHWGAEVYCFKRV